MLKSLLIKNYALIQHLEMAPHKALNIITGETGAGKSIMLGAVGLLLGQRADTRTLYNPENKCVVEGHFALEAYELQEWFEAQELDYEAESVLRREISPSGKSRAFVNDTPVTLEVMRQLGGYLMDIHSQHDTLQLGNHQYQQQVLDAYAGNKALLKKYSTQYRAYKKAQKALEQLQEEARTLQQEADYKQFLLEELRKAGLQPEEQAPLEQEQEQLSHAGDIKEHLHAALQGLQDSEYATLNTLYDVTAHLQHLARFGQDYKGLHSRLDSCLIELKDLAGSLENLEQGVDMDPARLDHINQRLGLIYDLQKKHQVDSVQALLNLQAQLQEEADKVNNLDEALAGAQKVLEQAQETMQKTAVALRQKRQKAAAPLDKALKKLLAQLGMPNAQLQVSLENSAYGPTGADLVTMRFSANKGVAPQELKQVASGGEFSRLMFCIKYLLADKTALPTIVFDEIDTGVSGEIAMMLGHMMQQMAASHQVVSISHLPQVAACGQAHYYVYKDSTAAKTVSRLKELTLAERTEEIAKMIGGAHPTESAYESARELLGQKTNA